MTNDQKNKIIAAKSPVQAWLDHRDQLLQALEDHNVAGTQVIGDLVKTAGANGPFRFRQGRVNFRKAKGHDYYKAYGDTESTEL